MERPRSPVKVCAALAAAICGCDARQYRPVLPHQSEGTELRAEAIMIRTLPPLTVDLRIDGRPGATLQHALLAPKAATPCREGIRQSTLELDGRRPWLRPVELEGEHTLRLTFPVGASDDLLRDATAVDLVLGSEGDRCLRVVLTGPEPDASWTTTFRGYASRTLRGDVPIKSVGGIGPGLSYDVGFGGYVGPLRMGVEGGVGSAACTTDCRGDALGFFWLPVGASVSSFLFDKNGFGLEVGAAYRVYFASIGDENNSRSVALRAAEARITLAGTLRQGPGLPSGARVAASGLDLILSDWRWPGPRGNESSFAIGIGLRGEAGW